MSADASRPCSAGQRRVAIAPAIIQRNGAISWTRFCRNPAKSPSRSIMRLYPINRIAAQFLVDLRAQDGVAAHALEFGILTAARSGEVLLGARWDEIEFGEKVWVDSGRPNQRRPPASRAAIRSCRRDPVGSSARRRWRLRLHWSAPRRLPAARRHVQSASPYGARRHHDPRLQVELYATGRRKRPISIPTITKRARREAPSGTRPKRPTGVVTCWISAAR